MRAAILAGAMVTCAALSAQRTIVPAAQRSAMGNAQTIVPLGSLPTRYQQVFLGSELPSLQPINCLGFRLDPGPSTYYAQYTVEIEVRLGETTYGPQTLTSSFAGNYDRAPPTTVVKRQKVSLPELGYNTVQPTDFELQLPTDVTYTWTGANANLLLDITVWSNSVNRTLDYPVDSVNYSTTTGSVLSFGGPTATTGKVIPGTGLVVRFADLCTLASYNTFGTGCPGTGNDGLVLPATARTQWLNGNLGSILSWRAQQLLDANALPASAVMRAIAFRSDEGQTYNPTTQIVPVQVEIGYTSMSAATLSPTFTANRTDPMTVVFQGNLSIPPIDPRDRRVERFDHVCLFNAPFIYSRRPNKHLLLDIDCNATLHGFVLDADTSAIAPGAFASSWPNGDRTVTTGTVTNPGCIAVRFGILGSSSATPMLYGNRQPVLGGSYDIVLQGAGGAAALLVSGFSDQTWGPFQLPLDLTPLGAPGCSLLTGIEFSAPTVVSATGDAQLLIPVPSLPALLGARLYNQYLVLEPSVNTLGLSFSNGGVARFGDI